MFEMVPYLVHQRANILGLGSMAINLKKGPLLLNSTSLQKFVISPARTTMVVKRRYPVSLYKEENKPRLSKKNFHYILEEDTETRPEPLMDIMLTKFVSGAGNRGDIISMKISKAYYNYLLPGLADYVTPENLEISNSLKADEEAQRQLLTPSVDRCIKVLENRCIYIVMNKETEWTVEPWHVRASCRKAGIHILSDNCIELPKHPIKGPNMDLEGKEFTVTITINNYHKVKTRCRIHHWSTNIEDRLPYEFEYWSKSAGKIFEENEDSKQTKDSLT